MWFDVGVINPDSFSDALMPVPGGPSLDDLASCTRVLAEAFEVAGASLVEYCGLSQESRGQLIRLLVEGGVTPALRGLIE